MTFELNAASRRQATLKRALTIVILATLVVKATTLDNGLALTPAMGFNSWYALHNHLTSPGYEWEEGYVLSDDVLDVARWMKQNGYQSLGYEYINLDDCIVVNRTSDGTLVPDPKAFPHGVSTVLNVSRSLHAMGFKFGWYTDRGDHTCAPQGDNRRPGSAGHEKQDAETYAAWGVDYLKEDNCFGDRQKFYEEYAMMRDGLNATKRPIYFNLCWGMDNMTAKAKVGKMYGNEWRISTDDGGGWGPIMQNVEVDSELYMDSGPGGWNDPGLLLAGLPAKTSSVRGRNYSSVTTKLTDAQGRTQFNLWSILAAKLLISADPRTFSAYTNETYTNPEVIAVDQDPLGKQGKRFTPAGNSTNPGEVWGRQLHDGWALLFFNNNGEKAVDIECSSACWAQTGIDPNQKVNVRDLWKHQDLGTANGSYTVSNVERDASVMLKLTQM